MSYDCRLVDPVTKEILHSSVPHHIVGGTYVIGGTNELWVNITYNYGLIYTRVMGGSLYEIINGKLASETISMLQDAINKLGDDVDPNYWTPTEGNAKKALYKLLALAQMRPDGLWEIT